MRGKTVANKIFTGLLIHRNWLKLAYVPAEPGITVWYSMHKYPADNQASFNISLLHLNIFRLLIFGAYTYENNNENSSFLVALKEHNLTNFCHYFYWNSLTSVLINIQDATPLINDLYYPLVSSTFFGQSLAHHQEHPLMNCTKYWYVRAIRRV